MSNKTNSKAYIPTVFQDIETPEELKCYLDDSMRRLDNTPYLHHYTSVSRVVDMIRSGTWHLGNAKGMNDNLEYKNGDATRWRNLFFSCFMCEDKESIGMWSMYAQPWEKGVKISIPKASVKKWLKTITEILEISTNDYQPTGRRFRLKEYDISLRLSSVAYCNSDSLQGKTNEEKIMWSTAKNIHIKNAVRIPELTGYIKDMAWSYEKEIRIKAEFDNVYGVHRIAIPLTEDLINAMTITASPLFEGSLEDVLKKEIASKIKTEQSMFTHRLNIKTICQECKLKQKYGSKLI